MDIGFQQAKSFPITTSIPLNWLGRVDAPFIPPAWATIGKLTSIQVKNLLAQIAYDASEWDYTKIGPNNELGRYQIGTQTLEEYGLLAKDSNQLYGTDCVNYIHCWRPVIIRKNTNSYANYIYYITNLQQFTVSISSQEHLAFQILYDLYTNLIQLDAITDTDTPDIVAGMLYVAWTIGAGTMPNKDAASGSGAYAWRYHGIGTGAASSKFNSGRYAITILSQ